MTQVSAQNLAFSFGTRPLFADVSFALGAGELLYVRGSNGAGKSTLLKVIAGLLPPTRGSIKLPDNNQAGARCSYLSPEQNGLYLHLSAATNLQFWTELSSDQDSPSQLWDSLKLWGLSNPVTASHLPVSKFSTGMKRRLALARVFSCRTNLYLLDEPTFGLDQAGCALLRTELHKLKERGACVIVVSHDPEFLGKLTNKTLALSVHCSSGEDSL